MCRVSLQQHVQPRTARAAISASTEWDGVVDEEAHLGLDDDDTWEEPVPAIPGPAGRVPPNFASNDKDEDDFVDWGIDESWEEDEPWDASQAFVADWGVDETAYFDDDDDDDD